MFYSSLAVDLYLLQFYSMHFVYPAVAFPLLDKGLLQVFQVILLSHRIEPAFMVRIQFLVTCSWAGLANYDFFLIPYSIIESGQQ